MRVGFCRRPVDELLVKTRENGGVMYNVWFEIEIGVEVFVYST